MIHRKTLIVVDNFTTKEAKTKPKKILPMSPIKTLALGKLKGKNPKQAIEITMHIQAMSCSLAIKKEKIAMNPNPRNPVNPAIPFIPSIKL